MPIVGLTLLKEIDQVEQLPRLATLYKGGKKGANKPGKDLDHFRVEFPEQFEARLRPAWEELYGERPTEFPNVFLMGDTADAAFQTWMEEWGSATLKRRCDRENQVRRHVGGDYTDEPIPCAAPHCNCVRIGRLPMIIPDLIEVSGMFGYAMITTHSVHDILKIHGYLRWIERLYGSIQGVPFVLGRARQEISVPNYKEPTGPRIKAEKSLLFLHADPGFVKTALAARLQPGNGDSDVLALPEATHQAHAEIVDGEPFDIDEITWPSQRPGLIAHLAKETGLTQDAMRKSIEQREMDGKIEEGMNDGLVEEIIMAAAEARKGAALTQFAQDLGGEVVEILGDDSAGDVEPETETA